MTNVVGLALFALGVVLLITGFSDSPVAGSRGSPGPDSLWLILGGAITVIGGLWLALRGTSRI